NARLAEERVVWKKNALISTGALISVKAK
ncbi:MAG: hypothetical protein RL127_1519, partial [Bacteroidota bacterium]